MILISDKPQHELQKTPFGLSLSKPPTLSLSFDRLRTIGGSRRQTLRHGAFAKLSPLLRANGAEDRR
jgi:hypothetical protein